MTRDEAVGSLGVSAIGGGSVRADAGGARTPLLLHVFPSFAVGGAQARFATLANRLGARYRHAVIALDGRYECRERLEARLDVGFPCSGRLAGSMPAQLLRFRRLLRDIAPDLLVTSNWGTIEWALANIPRRVPHLHMEDGFGPEERERQLPRRVLLRRIALRGSTVVLPSRTLLTIALTRWRLSSERLVHLPNGVDLELFAPGPDRPADPRAPVVGTVAALRPEKNLGRLLRAFAGGSPPGTILEIVGDGPERGALEALAASLGLGVRVRFLGHRPDPSQIYRGFDLFALASDTEQMPLSVLEAMASGLAIAATDVGDTRDMVAPANHPFIGPCDDGALARSFTTLLADRDLRRTIGAANRDRATTTFDETTMVGRWAALIDRTIASARLDLAALSGD